MFNNYSNSIPSDVQEFLDGYPNSTDNLKLNANVQFYKNQWRCKPDRLLIDELLEQWDMAYDTLESKHGFIQWLFPIKEYGVNSHAQPLQQHEIDEIKADPMALKRVIGSYKLMLDFYGMRLVSEESGLVDRAMPPKNYRPRYANLTRSSHNNLRISRILKCLSEFGLERFNAGFLLHVLNEQSEGKELDSRMIISSMDRWWANCIRDDHERTWISQLISKVRTEKGTFTFTRQMYLEALERRRTTGRLDKGEES